LKVTPEDSLSNFYLTNKNTGIPALKSAEELAEKSPSADNYIDLSLVYYNHGLFEKCILAAEKALELDPENKFAYNNIGSANMALKNSKEATDALTKALRIDPQFERAQNNLDWVKKNLPISTPQ